MNTTIRNILAVIAGIVAGGAVNMSIIMIGGAIIPPPEGADMTTVEGMKAAMPLLGAQHFLMPFLAHSIGTFAGALIAAMIAASHKLKIAIALGVFYLLGGLTAAMLIPAPAWFIAADLILAYIPTAYLAGKLASGQK